MKKNIIIISIIVVFVAVLVAVVFIKSPEERKVNKPVVTDAVTDIKNDLESIDFGNLDKEFDVVNNDIESL